MVEGAREGVMKGSVHGLMLFGDRAACTQIEAASLHIFHPGVLAVCKDSYSSREGIFVCARLAYARCTALLLCPKFSIANRSG